MSMYDNALEPTAPTPQDYGFPASPSLRNIQCWDHQEAFLKAYGELGTILHAARAVGIHRTTVNLWLSSDLYSIKKRMELAHQDYVESVERLMNDRLANPTGNRGSDVLLMFKLKAEHPEKYREEVKVIGVDSAKQMMDRLREMAIRERAALGPGEGVAVEGVYREVSGSGHEPAVNPTPGAKSADVSSGVPEAPRPIPKETSPSGPPAVGRPKPGRYQQRREKPRGRFTRR
jgi:hypothetical protein